jgi:hypothetical protein
VWDAGLVTQSKARTKGLYYEDNGLRLLRIQVTFTYTINMDLGKFSDTTTTN